MAEKMTFALYFGFAASFREFDCIGRKEIGEVAQVG